MTRRDFIKIVGVAAGTTLPLYALATACSSDSGSGRGTSGPGGSGSGGNGRDRRTTLDATIALAAGMGYRALVWGPGEPFIVRDDLGVSASASRESQRRSLLYFGQLSDTHVIDAQTPSRADWSFALNQNPSALRPQETLSVHVLA